MIIGINESKTLAKNASWKCECKLDGRKCNLNQKWNNDNCWCECKNQKEHHVYEKNVFGILLQLVRKTFFLGVIIDDSVDTCDGIIGRTKTVPTKSTSTQTV